MLWQNILGFDLDYPLSEYGFSTRLETENNWTFNFAQDAIIEYKKFMYLATVSDTMVSPSEIVDVVWHQHLIFTQSYESLCTILGKKIEHIPSTHNRSDYNKFKQAKDHTQKLYKEHFGEQPAELWEYPDIYGPLLMKKWYIGTDNIIKTGVLSFFPLLLIIYYFLRPVYVNIYNPYFVMGYLLLLVLAFIGLTSYNFTKFAALINSWSGKNFMLNLSPLELVYLKGDNVKDIINGVINQLVKENRISVTSGNTLSANDMSGIKTPMELCIMETIRENNGKIMYPALLKQLTSKPIFNKTARAMEGYKKHVSRSSFFIRLFILNFSILYVVLLLGVVRITTGMVREKPVVFITLIVIGYLIWMIIFLHRFKTRMGTSAIIQFYKNKRPADNNWEWEYFLRGPAVFVPVFLPLADYAARNGSNSGGDAGGSSGCGSSCGGGCGGCGGGD